MGYEPSGNDFYEPHTDGWFFKRWKSFFAGSFFNSKKYQFTLNQRYRFTDKLSVGYRLRLEPQKRNIGFADFSGNDIIFGRRNISTVENIFSIKYNFNKKMGLRTDIRHYWSKVDYGNPDENFFKLLANGKMEHTTSYTGNANQNYNAFNVDAVFTWEFAPGSFIYLVWKNSNPLDNFNTITKDGYFKNLGNTLDQSHNNNLSFKILYFLDYLQLKNHKKKNKAP